jgi:hypothetical protein
MAELTDSTRRCRIMEQTRCWKTATLLLLTLMLGVAGCQPAQPASTAAAKAKSPDAAPVAKSASKTPQEAKSSRPAGGATAELNADTAVGQKPSKPAAAAATTTPANEEPADAEKPRDLGPPLVEDPAALRRLDPVSPVWLDKKHRQVVFQGEVCQANYPLEFLVTYPDRAYESVMVAKVKPSVVHAGLVFLGAEPGHPAQFDPKYEPATGTPVEIRVCWKDKFGQRQDCLARDWVRNIKTRKALDIDWVFGGSHLVKNPTTGKQEYLADMSGDFVSVLNLGSVTLDLPLKSEGAIESRSFEGYTERLPPAGTPVTLLLRPKLAAPK